MKRFAVASVVALVLTSHARAAPLGLPPMPHPADNPPTKAKVDLGRRLFMDRRLSHNNTISCAMCHVPEQAFASNELGAAVGIEGQSTRRNAPTTINAGYVRQLFHDGRENSLENQAWGPLLAANEMGNPSIGFVVDKINALADYKGLFEKAFGGHGADMKTIGQALAVYQRTLASGVSRFDRWRYRGDQAALSEEEKAGFAVFAGKGGCIACHPVGERHALFTDGLFHNTGLGYARSMGLHVRYRVDLGGGASTEVGSEMLDSFEQPLPDVGRYEITLNPVDRWAYRTPSLRNVAATGPYMHDGSLATLEEVIEFYDRGGVDNPDLSPLIRPLALTKADKAALAAFLRTLTGSNLEALAADARRAPTGDRLPDEVPETRRRARY